MLKNKLKELIEKELPGEVAHQKLAPIDRPLSSFAKENAENYRESAVALIILEANSSHEIILIQRSSYDGAHSGQVSFPGGKKEANDINLLATAIRESKEEIGIHLGYEQFIGKLTPVFIPVSSFHVDVNLFYLNENPIFLKDEKEVESIFTIKLEDLLNDENIKTKNIDIGQQKMLKNVPYFDLNEKEIWGATALILSELKEILKEIKI